MEAVKLSQADWPFLRRESLIAMGALLFAAIVVWLAWNDYRTAHQQRDEARSTLLAAQNRLAAVEGEKAELIQILPEYRTLLTRGLLGDEQREAWRGLLRRAREHARLDTFSYELTVRKPFPANEGTDSALLRYRSTMSLETGFAHELDFLVFIEKLMAEAPALVVPTQCALTRTPAGSDTHNPPPPLAAQCTLDWITLKRREAPQLQEATP